MRAAVLLLALAVAVPSFAAGPPGGATPQAVVERLREATAANDLGEVVACMTPKSRTTMAAGLFAGAAMMVAFADMGMAMGESLGEGDTEADAVAKAADAAAIAALKERFGSLLRKYELGDLEGDSVELDGEALERRFGALDHGAFVTDLMALMESMPGAHSSTSEKNLLPDGDLQDLVIDGDTATARLGDEPVRLERIDGRWYVEEPEEKIPEPQSGLGSDEG